MKNKLGWHFTFYCKGVILARLASKSRHYGENKGQLFHENILYFHGKVFGFSFWTISRILS